MIPLLGPVVVRIASPQPFSRLGSEEEKAARIAEIKTEIGDINRDDLVGYEGPRIEEAMAVIALTEGLDHPGHVPEWARNGASTMGLMGVNELPDCQFAADD